MSRSMSSADYIYADARVKYREKFLLSNEDMQAMAAMPSAQAVMEFLKSKGWDGPDASQAVSSAGSSGSSAVGASSGDVFDSMLSAEEQKTQKLMEELKLDPQFLEVLSYPKLFHNLKSGIKEIVTTEPHPKAFYSLKVCGRDEILKILREKDYESLPKVLQEIAPQAFEAMLKTGDGQTVDMMVDRACLMAMEKAGLSCGSELLKEYLTTTVAVDNIKIAARCQKMGKKKEFILSSLAPCSSLSVEDLADAASKTPDDLYTYLSGHGYAEGAEALKKSFSAFERFCDDRLMEKLRTQHDVYESSGPVLAYYLAREAEISSARVILTGKANGFSEEAIRERVRQMYV